MIFYKNDNDYSEMKTFLMLIASFAAGAVLSAQEAVPAVETLSSPDGNLSLKFTVTERGEPCYWLDFKDRNAILPSTMGLDFTTDSGLKKSRGALSMRPGSLYGERSRRSATITMRWP